MTSSEDLEEKKKHKSRLYLFSMHRYDAYNMVQEIEAMFTFDHSLRGAMIDYKCLDGGVAVDGRRFGLSEGWNDARGIRTGDKGIGSQ